MLGNLIFRKVHAKDIEIILRLFKIVFKKNISEEFYNWRYYDKGYNSFVALIEGKIIGHIGFVKYKINNLNYIFSRHSTFIIPKFQRKGVYYKLLKYSFSKLKRKSNFVVAWPNSMNLASSKDHNNFKVINTYRLLYKKNYKKKKDYLFNEISEKYLKTLKFNQKNHLFFRDKKFLNWRYKTYPKDKFFFLDKKNLKNFIFQKKVFDNKSYFLIIDYYGNHSKYEDNIKLVLKFLLKNKINFQVLVPNSSRKLNFFLKKEKIKSDMNKFYVGLYKIGNKLNLQKIIERKIKYEIKIVDTDVFIKTF